MFDECSSMFQIIPQRFCGFNVPLLKPTKKNFSRKKFNSYLLVGLKIIKDVKYFVYEHFELVNFQVRIELRRITQQRKKIQEQKIGRK